MAVSSPSAPQRASLAGRRILVVEDEYFLADDIRNALHRLGADVAGPVGHIEDALSILYEGGVLDAAVLDVNIRSEMVFPIARELKARNVPFLFTTGYESITLGPEFQHVPLLEKPIDLSAMAHKLVALTAERHG